jgi:alkanesulfonate monooxygenase SsuD/methylene tetrahydromethanopterin reductase-like flavin-dependent oxidoreductase (luciferase family)
MLQRAPMPARFTAEAQRLRLNAGVVLLPLLSPLHVAEEFATLDVISAGKIIPGAGLGYRDIEFKTFGVPRRERAGRFEKNLIALRRRWTEEKVTMKTRYFELDGASCLPKRVQNPHPPIWVSANADPAIQRAARLGDCWYIGPGIEIATIERQMMLYRRTLDAAEKPFPTELPMRRECSSRRPATRRSGSARPISAPNMLLTTPGIRIFHSGFDQKFGNLIGDRFLIWSADEVAEQVLSIHRRLGVNHLVKARNEPACRIPSRLRQSR